MSIAVNPEALTLLTETLRGNLDVNTCYRLVQIRALLSDFSRAYQDATLVQLQRAGMLVLYRNDRTNTLTAADHAAALTVGGEPRHLVYLTT